MLMMLVVMICLKAVFDEIHESLYSIIVLCNFYICNLIVKRSWSPDYAQPCYQD